MIRRLIIRIKGKLYVVPTLFGLGFGVFSIVVLYFDHFSYENYSHLFPDWFFVSGSAAIAIFSLVSSSLVTMVTITFSIMMVVLTIYGSQLSPRSLQDFLSKKTTLRILGYFIGALIFSLLQLTFAKNGEMDKIIAPTICILILIIGVIVLIYFIHFISKSIQITHYIDDVVKETISLLDKSKKLVDSSIYIQSGNLKDYSSDLTEEVWEVKTNRTGYIQFYDRKKLIEIAKEFDVKILCEILIGEYILPNDVLIKVYGLDHAIEKEKLRVRIVDTVYIGNEQDLYKDISTGTRRLLDVALKALSPSINDPSTAVLCIEKIGYLLFEISKGLEANVYLDEEKSVRVIIRSISFNRLLYNHFYQIKHYCMKDLFVLEAVLTALTRMASDSTPSIKRQVWDFVKYLIADINLNKHHEKEQRILSERIYQLSRVVDVKYEFYDWKEFGEENTLEEVNVFNLEKGL